MHKIRIYQINKEHLREWGFKNYDWFSDHGHEKMDRDMYDLVWEGETEAQLLSDIYDDFNLYPPEDFKGRPMSTSDIVEREDGLYFVDSICFVRVEWDDGGEDRG